MAKKKVLILYLMLSIMSLNAGPRIQFRSDVIDLGVMKQRETRTKEIVFKNVGNEDLEIKKVRSSCSCAVGEINPPNNIILPRGTGKIQVTFNSQVYRGKIIKKVHIHPNDPENSEVCLKVKEFQNLILSYN